MTDRVVTARVVAILLLMVACLTTASASGANAGTITVRIYNSAQVPVLTVVAARRTAEAMFSYIGLKVIFRCVDGRARSPNRSTRAASRGSFRN